jgi:hypothetical protein
MPKSSARPVSANRIVEVKSLIDPATAGGSLVR